MNITNYLAELWGILMIVVSLALIVKDKYIKTLFSSITTDLGMFLYGIFSTTIGTAMILAHNIWTKDWKVIITIFAWAALLKGLAQLFMPEKSKEMIKKAENFPYLSYALLVVLVVGLVLTYLGFTA